jgi:hypothetical protein
MTRPPVEYLRQGAERALLAPDLRINYGFIAGWEAALEGKLTRGLTAGERRLHFRHSGAAQAFEEAR